MVMGTRVIKMLTNDNIFLIFIGILISDIVYQSGLVTKIYTKILHIEEKIRDIEEKVKEI